MPCTVFLIRENDNKTFSMACYLCAMLKETLINATEAGAAVLKYYFNNKNLKITNKEGVNNLCY